MSNQLHTLLQSTAFKWAWGGLVIACTSFFVVFVPLNLRYHFELSPLLLGLNLFASFVFILDIGVNFAKIQNQHTRLEIGVPQSYKEYLSRWFIFDLLAVLPLGLLGGAGMVSGLFRLMKLVSVGRIMHSWRNGPVRHTGLLRLSLSFFWILLLTHWIACGWTTLQDVVPGRFWADEYMLSLYWAVTTITTVGYGDVTPETNMQRLYAIGAMISGLVFYGYLIGNIAGILFKRDPAQEMYINNLERLHTTAKHYQVPPELERKIYEHFTYMWKNRRGYFESDLLESLPGSLKAEVSRHMKKDILQKIPFFNRADNVFLDEISLLLKPRLAEPGDYLFREGEVGKEMFFVLHGQLEVIAADGKTVIHLMEDGQFFGEIALFKNKNRTASVRAVTFCDLYALSRDSLNEVLKRYPEFADEVARIAEARDQLNQL